MQWPARRWQDSGKCEQAPVERSLASAVVAVVLALSARMMEDFAVEVLPLAELLAAERPLEVERSASADNSVGRLVEVYYLEEGHWAVELQEVGSVQWIVG